MNELRPYGRELLESARREHTPSEEARSRVHASLSVDRARMGPSRLGTGLSLPPLRGAAAVVTLLGLLLAIAAALYLASHRP